VGEREVMTVTEAADFLRLSVSTMHQRKNIPRHRVPGSREYRYIRSELLAWLKGEYPTANVEKSESNGEIASLEKALQPMVDISSRPLYHRNAHYR
jgi:excisionase family DNA binding protein